MYSMTKSVSSIDGNKILETNLRISQRELADELGVSLGKANYCIRAMMDKGLVTPCLTRWDFPIIPCPKRNPGLILPVVLYSGTIIEMKKKHLKTIKLIYSRPTSGNVSWVDIEGLFKALGADISERAGSRVAVVLFGEVRVFHRPHPSPNTDKGAISSIRKWLEENEVTP